MRWMTMTLALLVSAQLANAVPIGDWVCGHPSGVEKVHFSETDFRLLSTEAGKVTTDLKANIVKVVPATADRAEGLVVKSQSANPTFLVLFVEPLSKDFLRVVILGEGFSTAEAAEQGMTTSKAEFEEEIFLLQGFADSFQSRPTMPTLDLDALLAFLQKTEQRIGKGVEQTLEEVVYAEIIAQGYQPITGMSAFTTALNQFAEEPRLKAYLAKLNGTGDAPKGP